MSKRKKYVVKVFEAQWDVRNAESVRPFFEELRRNVFAKDKKTRTPRDKGTITHDALYAHHVFQGPDSLRLALSKKDPAGLGGRSKIAYIGCHGDDRGISGIVGISKKKLAPLLSKGGYEGVYFGTCNFLGRKNAEYLLERTNLLWVAGYADWVPWLEGTLCDLMFFRLLFDGYFFRYVGGSGAKWARIDTPQSAAFNTYEVFPMAKDMRFSLFTRKPGRAKGVDSSLADWVYTQVFNLSELNEDNKTIAERLNETTVPGRAGKKWTAALVAKVLEEGDWRL